MRPFRWTAFLTLLVISSSGFAQDGSKPESTYVKLLKKAPEERVGQIVEMIGKRGTTDDLTAVYHRAIAPNGFPSNFRLKAFEVLSDAALTRNLKPGGDLAEIGQLIDSGPMSIRLAAIKLAGHWKVEAAVSKLGEIAQAGETPASVRAAAFVALGKISPSSHALIVRMAAADIPVNVRALAIAEYVRLTPAFGVAKAVQMLARKRVQGAPRSEMMMADDLTIADVTPMIAAFLEIKGGADLLARAIDEIPPTPDAARLCLRAVYAMGRSDDVLIAALSKSAGIEAEPKLPTKEEMDALVQEVVSKGNSERGEAIFRRGELNCMKCHAIAGAAGGVGPELSSLGLSSPVDYVINSILIPDQAIKEEYQTRQVLTDDGRTLQGIVVEEDDKKLVLKDATGEIRTIPAGSVEDSKKGGSLMPKGLASLLTRGEFVDLVRFLSELGKPGPYASRSVPTIQRWRVLKSSPDEIAGVLQAEPSDWSPAYGQTNGALPLADLSALTTEKSVYLQGEIAVSAAGSIQFRFNSTKGLTAWLDDQPIPAGDSPSVDVSEGSRKLTLKIEIAARDFSPIRVEIARPEASSAQFSVVGGR